MPVVDTAYYALLGVESECSQQELSSAFKKRALKLHPDKGGNEEQFKAMKAAYDVLKDPQKRHLYDTHGPAIVRVFDGEVMEPEVMLAAALSIAKTASKMVFMALPFVALILLSPAVVISLKWDKTISWGWEAVFIPMWIVQISVVLVCFKLHKTLCNSMDSSLENCEDQEERSDVEKKKARIKRVFGVIMFVMLLLLVQELGMAAKWQGMKELKEVSWFFVILPYFTFELFMTYIHIQWTLNAESGRPIASLLVSLWWGMLRVSTAGLMAAKADGEISCSWMMCLVPLMIGAVFKVLWSIKGTKKDGLREEASGEEEPQGNSSVGVCLGITIWLSTLCLGAGKLDGEKYSAFRVFIPWFIFVGILLCCCSCVACCGPLMLDAVLKHEREGGAAGAAAGARAASSGQSDEQAQNLNQPLIAEGGAANQYSTMDPEQQA